MENKKSGKFVRAYENGMKMQNKTKPKKIHTANSEANAKRAFVCYISSIFASRII